MQLINQTIETHSAKIEKEKMKALGKKNQVKEEIDSRIKREQEIKLMKKEKIEELERLKLEYQSLEKIENDQKIQIEKLSNNDENYN